MFRVVEVLVLNPERGLCFLDGRIYEVKLNLDEKVAAEVIQLLEDRDGRLCIELALDVSGKGRIVGMR